MRRAAALGIVLLLLAVLAGITAPGLLEALERGAQKRTMGDIRTIATACEGYAVDHGQYPVVTSVEELAPLLEPTYVRRLPLEDAWGRPFAIASTPTGFVLASTGGDGLWEGAAAPRSPNGGSPRSLTRGDLARAWWERAWRR